MTSKSFWQPIFSSSDGSILPLKCWQLKRYKITEQFWTVNCYNFANIFRRPRKIKGFLNLSSSQNLCCPRKSVYKTNRWHRYNVSLSKRTVTSLTLLGLHSLWDYLKREIFFWKHIFLLHCLLRNWNCHSFPHDEDLFWHQYFKKLLVFYKSRPAAWIDKLLHLRFLTKCILIYRTTFF
jgi:hypothetical protein